MTQKYLDKYMKLIKKMEYWNDVVKANKMPPNHDKWDCKEMYHFEQDAIYRRFIKDIATDKINNMDDIIIISKLLNNKVVKNDKDLNYA